VLRSLTVAVALAALTLPVVAHAQAPGVHVRVEGRTQTIYGAAEPRLRASHALAALEAASVAGEFYYSVTTTSFGPYIDRIGRHPAAGTSGWVFKVNGASPPAGADQISLRTGDRVLWYWATFSESGGPSTLRLVRERNGCYRVLKEDDAGRTTPATGALLHVDGRRLRTRSARGCPGPHRGLVRATLAGAVRSNAVR
jgi:hypothetical protein